ncbi:MAG: hypothetical protein AABY15_02640 [Nanoarchaeota archaeon]
MELFYEVQYSENREKLWVHCSTGETVGRFDRRFGMDIHTTIEQQMKGASQCLLCTHDPADEETFDQFCEKAKELWGIEIDKSKIDLVDTKSMKAGIYKIEVTAALAYMAPEKRIQNASYNDRNGRFFIDKGPAGSKSVGLKSVRVIKRIS